MVRGDFELGVDLDGVVADFSGGKRGYENLHRFALRRLSRRGIRVCIIRQAMLQTVEWLEQHGILYWACASWRRGG